MSKLPYDFDDIIEQFKMKKMINEIICIKIFIFTVMKSSYDIQMKSPYHRIISRFTEPYVPPLFRNNNRASNSIETIHQTKTCPVEK